MPLKKRKIKLAALSVHTDRNSLESPMLASFPHKNCHFSQTNLTPFGVTKIAEGKAQPTLADRITNLHWSTSRLTNSREAALYMPVPRVAADLRTTRILGANSWSMIRQSLSLRKVKGSKR